MDLLKLAKDTINEACGMPLSLAAEDLLDSMFQGLAEDPQFARQWPRIGGEVLGWLAHAARGAKGLSELRRTAPCIEQIDLAIAFSLGFGTAAGNQAGLTRLATHFCPPIPDGALEEVRAVMAKPAPSIRAVG